MADVESAVFTTTTTERKTRKVKKTSKRRESSDQNADVTITELDNQTNNHRAIDEYVLAERNASFRPWFRGPRVSSPTWRTRRH